MHEARQKEFRDRAAREDYVRSEGRSEGEDIKLIALVQRKLQKGKSMSIIAEELEEPLVKVEQIIEAIEKCGFDADASKIYEQMQAVKS